jgi:hypothetical protein
MYTRYRLDDVVMYTHDVSICSFSDGVTALASALLLPVAASESYAACKHVNQLRAHASASKFQRYSVLMHSESCYTQKTIVQSKTVSQRSSVITSWVLLFMYSKCSFTCVRNPLMTLFVHCYCALHPACSNGVCCCNYCTAVRQKRGTKVACVSCASTPLLCCMQLVTSAG